MEIFDYIPEYPQLDDPEFNDKILHKEEFYELKTRPEVDPLGKPGDLWNHQKLIARFMSPYTPYNRQLLFHTPGTGKTCAAIAVAENNKLDPVLRKPILIIVNNETLIDQWKQQISQICTSGYYLPPGNDSGELTVEKIKRRTNKLIEKMYNITTLEVMRREIKKQSDQILHKRYSNHLIIIDEAHNLRIQNKTDQAKARKKKDVDPRDRYESFHRFLHVVQNSKILLLSGTPMYDTVMELPGLFNLLLPINEQLPTGNNFTREYMKKVGRVRVVDNEDQLLQKLVGLVSYIREGGNFPRRIDIGEKEYTSSIPIVNVPMEDYQLQGYLEAFKKDTTRKSTTKAGTASFWKNSRQAAVFIYERNDQYIWGTEASKLLLKYGVKKTIKIDEKELSYIPEQINPDFAQDLQENLPYYSAKFAYIVEFIKNNPDEPIFIFSPLVSGAGGAIFLGAILQLYGYYRARGTESGPGKRFAVITSDDASNIQRNKLIKIYNSPENRDGSIIHIMIASKTISEGTSFKNVRHEIVISPSWNNSTTEQAIGRGLRADSLSWLPPDKREVTVQELGIYNDELEWAENIDAHLYLLSEHKDVEIKHMERVLKKAAWDCALNYSRNVRANDSDGSRSCDYQKCNYICYQTNPERRGVWKYNVPEDDLDQNTYTLYYSKPEIMRISNEIKEILRTKPYINLNGLQRGLPTENFKLLVLAVEYLIENHVVVRNKWNQECYLRKENNMLFLSDTPTDDRILNSWYTVYPYINEYVPLDKVIDEEIYARDRPIVAQLLGKNCLMSDAVELYEQLSLESRMFMLEYIYRIDPEKLSTLEAKKFQKLFSKNVFNIDGIIVHNLAKIQFSQDYIDFTKGSVGRLRWLQDGLWGTHNKKEEERLSTTITELKTVDTTITEVAQNVYGVYAIITAKGTFKIVDKTKEAPKKDLFRGRDCKKMTKDEIIGLYISSKVKIPFKLDKTHKDKGTLIKKLDTAKLSNFFDRNSTIRQLQQLYTLNLQTKVDLCENLQKPDKRKIYRGKDCNSWHVNELVDLYHRLEFFPFELDMSITNKSELIRLLTKLDVAGFLPKKPTLEVLQQFYTLTTIGKKELCYNLREWFEEEGLVMTE